MAKSESREWKSIHVRLPVEEYEYFKRLVWKADLAVNEVVRDIVISCIRFWREVFGDLDILNESSDYYVRNMLRKALFELASIIPERIDEKAGKD